MAAHDAENKAIGNYAGPVLKSKEAVVPIC
jgi:hypothetical protein